MVDNVRNEFVQILLAQIGRPYVWGANGPGHIGFDCSGLMVYGLRTLGLIGPKQDYSSEDLRTLCSKLEDKERPRIGDFAIYGKNKASHIVAIVDGNRVISASGGDSTCTSVEIARRKGAAVRLHSGINYRPDLLGVYRNKWLERQGNP